MKRDFTEQAKNDLLGLVDQVESEKWCDATDWLGDRFLDLRSLVGELSIDRYLNNMGEYHKLVIDKNNTTRDKIEAIFANVYAVDGQYVARFAACKARLDQLVSLIGEMSQVIAPKGGSIAIDTARLDRAFAEFEQLEVSLEALGPEGTGITYDQLNSLSAEARQQLAERLIGAILETLPNGSLGSEISIQIGPGVKFYYEGKANFENDSDIDLEAVYEDGRIKLADFGYTVRSGDAIRISEGVSADGVSVGEPNYKSSRRVDFGGCSFSSSWKYGNSTYMYTDGIKLVDAEFYSELSVKTEAGNGSVQLTAGLRMSDDDTGWKLVAVPAYDPVPSYEPVSLPSIEVPSWVYVAVPVVAVAVGILLAPETGGASLALCAV